MRESDQDLLDKVKPASDGPDTKEKPVHLEGFEALKAIHAQSVGDNIMRGTAGK